MAKYSPKGNTVWLEAVDAQGRVVNFIQSIYWEFGSGTLLNDSGIMLQNQGTGFCLDDRDLNALKPHRCPFLTIQQAMAHLIYGHVIPCGTMVGQGQPQTQAMIFARRLLSRQSLRQAITAPRQFLGRT